MTRKHKDVFDLFRASTHRLEDSPSKHSWSRLESRLNAHQRRHRSAMLRYISMAAAIALLIGVFSLLSLLSKYSGEERGRTAFVVERLDPAVDPAMLQEIAASQQMYINHSARKYYAAGKDKKLVPVDRDEEDRFIAKAGGGSEIDDEQTNEQVLLSYNRTSNELRVSQAIDNVALDDKVGEIENLEEQAAGSKEMLFSEPGESDVAYTELEEVRVTGYGVPKVNSSNSLSTSPTKMEKPAEAKMEAEMKRDSDQALSKEKEMEDDLILAEVTAISKKQEKRSRKEKNKGKKREMSRAFPAAGISREKDRSQSFLAAVNWLTGRWTATSGAGTSLELWQWKDPNSLIGKGFLLQNSDTTFQEKMEITRTGTDWFYITSLDENQDPVRFKLTDFSKKELIFENDSLAFPQQIVFRTNADQTRLETIMQNKAPTAISPSQQQFISNRNVIVNEKASRILKRINK